MPTAAKQHQYPHQRQHTKSHRPPRNSKAEYVRPEHHRVYGQQRWRNVSKWYRRNNPLCEHCLDAGRTTTSQLVDHIKPIDEGGEVYDPDNLQALCQACHNRKTAKDKSGESQKPNPFLPV